MAVAVPESDESPGGESSTSRPLSVRRRSDIVVVRQFSGGGCHYVLKNPIDLQYYRLLEEEHFIWKSLTGTASLDSLKREFERRFAPQRIDNSELHRLIVTLHERNLVYSSARGQGEQLIRSRRERRRKAWLQRLSNPLALRFRGIDPDRFLTKLHASTSFLFHPAWLCLWALFLIGCAVVALPNLSKIIDRLPRIEEFFTPTHLFWLAAATATVKVIHELGHGLACKHFGGEVRELGLMLLLFMPCLYCNASDAWMFRSRRHRAAVAAAGLYFESMLAGGALWIWWLSSPGAVHDIALDVAVVCSISTLLFNGNPLLKFDGYYILADLLGIPNFSEKCSLFWRRTLADRCLGIEPPPDFQVPENRSLLLGTYGAAAFVYRWFVSLSIMYFFFTYLKQHKLTSVFFILFLLGYAPRLGATAWKWRRMIANSSLLPRVKPLRCAVTAVAAALVVAAVFTIPIPYYVICPVEIVPSGEQIVYAETPGVLVEAPRRFGDLVAAGETIAVLDNVQARLEERQAQARHDETLAKLSALERNQFSDPGLALEVAVTRKALEASRRLLAERRTDLKRLRIVAPVAGSLLPPGEIKLDKPEHGALPEWSGDVFERRNLGCTIGEGTALCRIGDPSRLEAELVIAHRDMELVAVGQPAEIFVDAVPGLVMTGTVVELGEATLLKTPKRLSNVGGGELSSKTDADGTERPRHSSYSARVSLNGDGVASVRAGVRGRAKVRVRSSTLYEIVDRHLRDLFTFRL